MSLYSVQKASELGLEERVMFGRMPGRTLAFDETISVNAWQPTTNPRRSFASLCGSRSWRKRKRLGNGAKAFHTKNTRHRLGRRSPPPVERRLSVFESGRPGLSTARFGVARAHFSAVKVYFGRGRAGLDVFPSKIPI